MGSFIFKVKLIKLLISVHFDIDNTNLNRMNEDVWKSVRLESYDLSVRFIGLTIMVHCLARFFVELQECVKKK